MLFLTERERLFILEMVFMPDLRRKIRIHISGQHEFSRRLVSILDKTPIELHNTPLEGGIPDGGPPRIELKITTDMVRSWVNNNSVY